MSEDRKWRKKYLAQLARQFEGTFEAIGAHVEEQAVKLISRDQAFKRSKSGTMRGLSPAKTGQPPKVLTGRLRQSLAHLTGRRGQTAFVRVGTNVVYGRVHEEGSHPYLVPALKASRSHIGRILGQTGKRGMR